MATTTARESPPRTTARHGERGSAPVRDDGISSLLGRVARPRGRRSLRSPSRRAERTALPHRHVPTVTHRGDLAALVVGLAVLVVSALPVDAGSVGGLERDAFRIVNGDVWLPYWPVWLLMQLGSVVAIYASAALAFSL